jgi:hypothetical protein
MCEGKQLTEFAKLFRPSFSYNLAIGRFACRFAFRARTKRPADEDSANQMVPSEDCLPVGLIWMVPMCSIRCENRLHENERL